jgi:hypothetical protein
MATRKKAKATKLELVGWGAPLVFVECRSESITIELAIIRPTSYQTTIRISHFVSPIEYYLTTL